MRVFAYRWLAYVTSMLLLISGAAVGGSPSANSSELNKSVTGQFAGIVPQGRDTSCGAAALASILTFWLDRTVAEEAILSDLRALTRDPDRVEAEGVSLRELAQVAIGRGFVAKMVPVPYDALRNVPKPTIVLLKRHRDLHLVVLLPHQGGHIVHLADPFLGHVYEDRATFLQQWVAEPDGDAGWLLVVDRPDGRYLAESKLARPPAATVSVIEAIQRQKYLVGIGRSRVSVDLIVQRARRLLPHDNGLLTERMRSQRLSYTFEHGLTTSSTLAITGESSTADGSITGSGHSRGPIAISLVTNHDDGPGLGRQSTFSLMIPTEGGAVYVGSDFVLRWILQEIELSAGLRMGLRLGSAPISSARQLTAGAHVGVSAQVTDAYRLSASVSRDIQTELPFVPKETTLFIGADRAVGPSLSIRGGLFTNTSGMSSRGVTVGLSYEF